MEPGPNKGHVSSPSVDGLVRRLAPNASGTDLGLPASTQDVLRSIALHARRQPGLEGARAPAASTPAPKGVTALFVGADSTAVTRAAEVVARELGRDLYRVDLDRVVSKYIGETEKNLNRVLAAAESARWVLLFDEADALFGKRTSVGDSHDRYANLETGYLLERLEAFDGLAILATNRKTALDDAFLRRIRHVVDLPAVPGG